MELKEAILKLPNLLERVEKFLTPTLPIEAAAPAPTVQSDPTKDVKSKDGKTLSIVGEIKPGADVLMDGKPCMDGNYEMEDGSTFVIQGGKLVDIQPKAIDAQPEAQAAATSSVANPPQVTPSKVTKYTETIFDAEFEKVEKLKLNFEEQTKIIKELVDIVQIMANQPSIETKINKKDGFKSSITVIDINEDIKEFRKRNGL